MKCFICGTQDQVNNHHIKPKAKGGTNHKRNLLPVCEKHHNEIEEFSWEEIMKLKQSVKADNRLWAKSGPSKRYRLNDGSIIEYSKDWQSYRKYYKKDSILVSEPFELHKLPANARVLK